MNRLLYYVASPYTHRLARIRKERFTEVSMFIAELTQIEAVAVLAPITTSYVLSQLNPLLGGSWEQWQDIDTVFLDHSDKLIVYMMDGWKTSVGVQAEIAYAQEIGIPIIYIKPDIWMKTQNFYLSIDQHLTLKEFILDYRVDSNVVQIAPHNPRIKKGQLVKPGDII